MKKIEIKRYSYLVYKECTPRNIMRNLRISVDSEPVFETLSETKKRATSNGCFNGKYVRITISAEVLKKD